MKEIEAKFKLESESILNTSNLIKKSELKVIDIYFDSDLLNLKSNDRVLRLRKVGDKAFIAYKGPREKHDTLIVRTEIEPEISSFEEGLNIVKALGFYEVAKVEKIRTTFTLDKYPSLKIELDKYPFIGLFLEVEGDEVEINLFLEENNLSIENATKMNCSESFLKFVKEKDIKFEKPTLHFTFDDEKLYSSD